MSAAGTPPLPSVGEGMDTLSAVTHRPEMARAWLAVNAELQRLRKIEKATTDLLSTEVFDESSAIVAATRRVLNGEA